MASRRRSLKGPVRLPVHSSDGRFQEAIRSVASMARSWATPLANWPVTVDSGYRDEGVHGLNSKVLEEVNDEKAFEYRNVDALRRREQELRQRCREGGRNQIGRAHV